MTVLHLYVYSTSGTWSEYSQWGWYGQKDCQMVWCDNRCHTPYLWKTTQCMFLIISSRWMCPNPQHHHKESCQVWNQYDKLQFIMVASIFILSTSCIPQKKSNPAATWASDVNYCLFNLKLVKIESCCVRIIAALAIWPLTLQVFESFKRYRGHAMVQAVWSHGSPRGLYGGKSGTGTVFSLSTSIFTCQYHSIMFCTHISYTYHQCCTIFTNVALSSQLTASLNTTPLFLSLARNNPLLILKIKKYKTKILWG